jgi:hypothetical protein
MKAQNQEIRLLCPIHDQNTFRYITEFAVNLTCFVGTIEDEERERGERKKKDN